jgi:transposase
MKAYSDDLRARVLAACDVGEKVAAVAERFLVSESWVRRVKQVRRESGRVTAARHAGGRTPAWVTHGQAIRDAVRQAPDLTLDEYRTRFALAVSRAALDRALTALRLPRKKSRCRRPSGSGRT